MRKGIFGAAVGALALFGLFGAANATEVRLMTGPQAGFWVPLGGQLKDAWEKAIPALQVQSLPGAGRGRRHIQPLLRGVRHGAVGAAHRVPSTFSQPIGTDPARRRSQSPTAIEAVTVT